jgi:AcrR family transcriptional regulator
MTRSPSPAKADAIVEAAEALFIRHGFRRTTMDDIARAAGVAKGTLYLYFASKEAVFDALHVRLHETVMAAAEAAAEAEAPLAERLFGVMDAFYGHLSRRYAHSEYFTELDEVRNSVTRDRAAALREAHFEIVARLFAAAERNGERARDLAATLVAAAAGAKGARDAQFGPLDYVERLRRICRAIAPAARR